MRRTIVLRIALALVLSVAAFLVQQWSLSHYGLSLSIPEWLWVNRGVGWTFLLAGEVARRVGPRAASDRSCSGSQSSGSGGSSSRHRVDREALDQGLGSALMVSVAPMSDGFLVVGIEGGGVTDDNIWVRGATPSDAPDVVAWLTDGDASWTKVPTRRSEA